jgi:Eco47II restriction endonuclease
MPRLSWISDKELNKIVTQLLDKAIEAKTAAVGEFGKNVIDPFSALFEISGFSMSYDEWIKSETARQAQKTLQNHIGDFHQKILGSCKGWVNMQTGSVIDLVCAEKKIIAEVKNKYNTISGGKLSELYNSLDSLVMPKSSIYKIFTAYYVTIIPKKPDRFDREFVPSDKEKGSKCAANEKIREIDGASFYSLVTEEQNALEDLFDILPSVISKITGKTDLNKDKLKAFFNQAYTI